ncbi:MAG: exopolyphosphatase [Gammaproteobacteria bacterium]
MQTTGSSFFAAVDLGSNSFHMVVAKYTDGQVQIVDRLKEMVRLADGLDADRNITEAAMERAIQCLERFGQRIKELPGRQVRAVGTNTLRQARNGNAFLQQARRALGHRIEIIAGREEARLIYLGVAQTVYKDDDRRLVVDIGGGSTELIIGQGFEPLLTESLYMGCVNMTQKFFADGKITAKRLRKAILNARQELEAIQILYRKQGWATAIGASGTIQSIHKIVTEQNWSESGITPASLQSLQENLLAAGHIDAIALDGLSNNRAPVFIGGFVVLSGIFEALKIDHMAISDGALREGLLHELIGRSQRKDIRETTIKGLQQRFSVDVEHADRVEATAGYCYDSLSPKEIDEPDRQLLSWSARLHELGQAIAHSRYQKHGAYLVQNADLPGFSNHEQHYVAILIRNHRRKITPDDFKNLPENGSDKLLRLCILLRLAVVLNRSRSSDELPAFKLYRKDTTLSLAFPDGWLEQHPLTGVDLEMEAAYLATIGWTLAYS